MCNQAEASRLNIISEMRFRNIISRVMASGVFSNVYIANRAITML